MATCDRPLWDLLASAVSDPDALFFWPFCAHGVDIGVAIVGVFVIMIGFVGTLNWSESWTLPLTWLAIVAPIVAAAALPGGMIRLIGGVVTFAVAMLFVGLWYWWGRS